MQKSKSSSSSSSSSVSHHSRLPSPLLSEYEYVGRLVTRERPIYYYSETSDEDLSKPLGVIRINDRHVQEIYRIPTPPPEIKRVVHRLRSPKPKIVERVFVRRPPQEIIEKVIEVPPQKVRVINREKHLRPSKPIIRTKVVYLKPPEQHDNENQLPTYQLQPDNYTQSINIEPTCYTYIPSPITPNYFSNYSQY